MADPTGIEAVLADLPDDVLGRGMLAPAEQLDMLAATAEGAADPHRAVAAARAAETDQLRRGRGRPAGSRNRRTQDWAEYLLSRYRSPLVVLAETYSRPAAELAAELGCSRLEAGQMQLKAAAELAPYLHGKMPVEVNLSGRANLVLSVPGLDVPLGVSEGGSSGLMIDVTPAGQVQQNQALSEADQ